MEQPLDPSPTAEATTFHALRSDVSDREDSGKARFKRIGRPAQRPAVLNLRTGLDETLCVERNATSKPSRVGLGAGHHKHMLNVPGFALSSFGVVQQTGQCLAYQERGMGNEW